MKELPKKLTAELLGLILGYKVEGYSKNIFVENSLDILPQHGKINIDTLTRLMKEWCNKNGYDVLTCLLSNNKSWCQLVEMKTDTFKGVSTYFHSETEFEAVLYATHWVATKEGLI